MSVEKLQNDIGGIDIYLLDQILKERYQSSDLILDAGCGTGRNLKWFYKNEYRFFGVDSNANSIETAKEKYPKSSDNFSVQSLDVLQFDDNYFDHVICSAVLHFAQNEHHFKNMFSELVRVVKPNGTIFIRMTSNFGIENLVTPISGGVYYLPDKTNRFLLTTDVLVSLKETFPFKYLEPLKTVNVNNIRCMSTLMLKKV